MKEEMFALWPDGTWCEEREVESYLSWRSDDYKLVSATQIEDLNEDNNMQTIDLSLNNDSLYNGCEIEEVAGRLNLKTPVAEAVNIVGRNINSIEGGDEVTLTGPMAVWAYLIVFHAVVHRFSKVYYDDGRNGKVLIAAHG
jgi:hypothetical protein